MSNPGKPIFPQLLILDLKKGGKRILWHGTYTLKEYFKEYPEERRDKLQCLVSMYRGFVSDVNLHILDPKSGETVDLKIKSWDVYGKFVKNEGTRTLLTIISAAFGGTTRGYIPELMEIHFERTDDNEGIDSEKPKRRPVVLHWNGYLGVRDSIKIHHKSANCLVGVRQYLYDKSCFPSHNLERGTLVLKTTNEREATVQSTISIEDGLKNINYADSFLLKDIPSNLRTLFLVERYHVLERQRKRELAQKDKEIELLNSITTFERSLVGKLFSSGHYKVIKAIGGKYIGKKAGDLTGCNSAVFHVKVQQRDVAMKVILNVHNHQSASIRSGLIRPEFVYRLPLHPNICRIHYCFKDTFETKDLPGMENLDYASNKTAFFIMPLYPTCLRKVFEKKENLPLLTISQTYKLIRDMCQVIGLMKKHNIIHRDIKDDNVFISNDGDYVLGDFGVSLDCEVAPDFRIPYLVDGFLKGGNRYAMPPEVKFQGFGKKKILKYDKYDMFSLGMLCYSIFRTKDPFGGEKNLEKNGCRQSYIELTYKECGDERLRSLIRNMLSDYDARVGWKEVLDETEKEHKLAISLAATLLSHEKKREDYSSSDEEEIDWPSAEEEEGEDDDDESDEKKTKKKK